jgi:hypothetical protein
MDRCWHEVFPGRSRVFTRTGSNGSVGEQSMFKGELDRVDKAVAVHIIQERTELPRDSLGFCTKGGVSSSLRLETHATYSQCEIYF